MQSAYLKEKLAIHLHLFSSDRLEIVPHKLEVLQHTGHLLTFFLQVLWTKLGFGDMRDLTTLFLQELQHVVRQLQHTQEVELSNFIHIP